MHRFAVTALLGLLACVPRAEKMSWPAPLPPTEIEALAETPHGEPATTQEPPPVSTALGGPLVEENSTPYQHVAYHRPETDWPDDIPRDGRNYLLLRWPLPATGINSLYGKRTDPLDGKERSHNGLDLEAEYGAVIHTAASGMVVYAGWNRGHGRQVIIEHEGGYQTSYSHLAQVLALPNSYIGAGQAIGMVGNSGRSTGPHLHLEVTRYGRYVDPLDVLGVATAID